MDDRQKRPIKFFIRVSKDELLRINGSFPPRKRSSKIRQLIFDYLENKDLFDHIRNSDLLFPKFEFIPIRCLLCDKVIEEDGRRGENSVRGEKASLLMIVFNEFGKLAVKSGYVCKQCGIELKRKMEGFEEEDERREIEEERKRHPEWFV